MKRMLATDWLPLSESRRAVEALSHWLLCLEWFFSHFSYALSAKQRMSEDLEVEFAAEEFAEDLAEEEVVEEDGVVEEVVAEVEFVGRDLSDELADEEDDSDGEMEAEDSADEVLVDARQSDGKVGENEVFQWSAFTGLRVKTYSADELRRFRRPFELGWTREVVLRGTVTSSGKKIGDVYYFSADRKTKLRSYVEMGLYLKRSASGLAPDNFTFARQPVYRPPHEIVRHAMQRGGGAHQPSAQHIIDSAPFVQLDASEPVSPSASRSARNSTASESEEAFAVSIAEGRAKRKRVAPTRFEDEDYSESPLKKKGQRVPSVGANGVQKEARVQKDNAGVKQMTSQPKQALSLQEKRRQLQHQLLQQVHEQTLKKAAEGVKTNGDVVVEAAVVEPVEEAPPVEEAVVSTEEKPKTPLSARKSIQVKKEPPVVDKEEKAVEAEVEAEAVVAEEAKTSDEERPADEEKAVGAPCSMHCAGRRGMLPNLMCSRCFCLYHLDCVPGGVFLEQPRVFVCPNCLKPEDLLSREEAPPVVSQPVVPQKRSTFAPILPKPPQLQGQHLFQQMRHKRLPQPLAPFNKSAAMAVKLPVGTHLYRVATGPNGHSMVVKDKSIKPKVPARSAPAPPAPPRSHPPRERVPNGFHGYRPAPIAPIGPMKHTPQELERRLRRLMRPTERRGFRLWMERRSRAGAQSLVGPFECLNRVLAFLTVRDLVRVRQVSRQWLLLASQPHLWRCVRLKGVHVTDWQHLAKNIVEALAVEELDFEGVVGVGDDFWRGFGPTVDFLKSVRTLRFGAAPTLALEDITSSAVTQNPYNSFHNLERLSVRNAFDAESRDEHVSLAFLNDFQALRSLTSLSLHSKAGFVGEVALLSDAFQQMALQSLQLTSLKDFSSEDFVFLRSLRHVTHLEIGSCARWFDSGPEDGAGELWGAFLYLSELQSLRALRLVDIDVDAKSWALAKALEALPELESVSFDNFRVRIDGSAVLDALCDVLSARPLKSLSLSTDDPHTNRRVCDQLFKRLDNCARLHWKVGVAVEDSGECFVPFARADDAPTTDDDADVEFRDVTFLNEMLQSELSRATIEIIPQ